MKKPKIIIMDESSDVDWDKVAPQGGGGGGKLDLDTVKAKAQPVPMNGQQSLEEDVYTLLADVVRFEFHDFKNTKYSLPKMALVERLSAIINKAQSGGYDN